MKTFDHPPFSLDLDLNDTIRNVKSKISDVSSGDRELVLSLLDDDPANDDSILWDQKIEDGATIYGIMARDGRYFI